MTYNSAKSALDHRFWSMLVLALGLLLWSGCGMVTVTPTATPTRTPQPSLTPTSTSTPTPTATLTPTPSPTPAFPVTVGCTESVPLDACGRLESLVAQDPAHFAWVGGSDAQVRLSTQPVTGGDETGRWFYAVAAPFFTVADELTFADLQATWMGNATGPFEIHPLMAAPDTVAALAELWGAPADAAVRQVAAEDLLAQAEAQGGWALVPFHALKAEWKVMRLDDYFLPNRMGTLDAYPLSNSLYLGSQTRPEVLDLLDITPQLLINRDEGQMTRVVMTGVTAMSRATARLMDRKGVTYPAKDILHWFQDADFVHVSNEVSFMPNCVAAGYGAMSFCSHDSYIGLLEAINVNIVELTGNHLGDMGRSWILHTLDMYQQRGWDWYGGGADIADATRPLTITHNGNQLAFLGCNPSGVGFFATEDMPGAALCSMPAQRELVHEQVRELRGLGYQPIVTLQDREFDQYEPAPQHLAHLRGFADAGAVIVHGSQAHWVKPMEFRNGAFVHYGPGNFFFDQMWAVGVRQAFIPIYTFYQGRLLNIDLHTTILEEYGRPRPMTVGDPDPAADRRAFLQMMFDMRPQ